MPTSSIIFKLILNIFNCHFNYNFLSKDGLPTSSSCMCVMNHNWSATKQPLHMQSVAEISCHSVLSGDRNSTMWNIVWVSPQGHGWVSVSRHFLLQAVSLFHAKTVQQRLLLPREVKTRIVGSHTRWELTTWADFQLCLHRLLMSPGCKSGCKATTA